jgi:hypothetical protein
VDDPRLVTMLKTRNILSPGNPTDPARKVFQSETGEITIDGSRDVLVLDTPRTAGGYAPAGQTIQASRSGVRIAIAGADATVWVSALDAAPIGQSRRLLVTHLTDLQNTGIRYAEAERKTLQAWGRLPHLVKAGAATVVLPLEDAPNYGVWALSTGGRRLAEIPTVTASRQLTFEADVAGGGPEGARMLYEVARR